MGSMTSSIDLRCSLCVSRSVSLICNRSVVFPAAMNMGIDARSPPEMPVISGPNAAARNVVKSPTALSCLLCFRALLVDPMFKESCSLFWVAHAMCSVRNAFLIGFMAAVMRECMVVATL